MNRMWFLAGMAVGVLAGATDGGVINVGPGGSIQAAVDAAQDGDEIVVAPGIYLGSLDIEAKDITPFLDKVEETSESPEGDSSS